MSSSDSVANITLRPYASSRKETLGPFELGLQLRQLVNAQGAHLRYITEASLQDEIESGKRVPKDDMEAEQTDSQQERSDAPTKEEQLRKLAETRDEMMRSVHFARFYAQSTLDLIALALTRDPSKSLDNAFSFQFKQQQISRASLGLAKTVPNIRPTKHALVLRQEYNEERLRLVGLGSRMKALESVTDDILKAATDLETEVKKEVKYWEEILDISAKGWYLQRLRRDLPYSPLAVRCGSHEASDQFKARGLAPLRMNKDGAIVLDPELAPKPRTLRVRIREHGKIVGCSRLSKSEDGTATGIEKKIRQARDSLFEEEMFHEMTIEARNLLPYGVELRDSVLNVQASSDRTVLIDCIPLDDEESTDEYATDDWLARTIAEGLRLLLSHEHRMRLFRRSQIPAPLTLNKRQTPPPPLLRTLLAVFAHLDAVDSLQTYLQKLVKTLETAGLPVTLDIKREVSLNALTRIITESPIKGLSPLDQIIQQFTKPLDSVATLSLPSPKGPDAEYVTIAIRTFFGPPTFGPEYKITLPPSLVRSFSLGEEMRKEFKFSSGESAHQYVDWVFSLHLTHNLLRKEYPKRAAVSVLEPTVIINGRDGKKVAKKEFAVDIKDGALTVTVRRATMFGVESVPECTWSWNGSEGGGDLLEKIHACVRR